MSGAQRYGSVWLLAATFLFSSVVFACTEAPANPAPVSRSFQVTASDSHHHPLAGVRVSLGTIDRYKTMHAVARGTTDSNGVLKFQNVPLGSFTLQFTDALGERQFRDVSVVKTGGADGLQYEWPYVNWIPLRSASALVKSNADPLRHYQVSLQGVPEGNVLGISDTDQLGRFDLPAERPGRYRVEILQPDTDSGIPTSLGTIPIEVTGDERLPALDTIYIAETSCGLQSDRICRGNAIESSCLHIVDSQGADIPIAFAKLTAKSGTVLRDRFKASAKAMFELADMASGEYEMEIFAAGFAPASVSVRSTADKASCRTPAVVTMNAIGYGCQPPAQGKVN